MEIVLTGKNFSAQEAAEWGLVSRVVQDGSVVDEAVKVAGQIAKKGRIAVQAAKEGVNSGESWRSDWNGTRSTPSRAACCWTMARPGTRSHNSTHP